MYIRANWALKCKEPDDGSAPGAGGQSPADNRLQAVIRRAASIMIRRRWRGSRPQWDEPRTALRSRRQRGLEGRQRGLGFFELAAEVVVVGLLGHQFFEHLDRTA